MREKFNFSKSNTELDKKMRALRGDSISKKLVGVAIAAVLIVVAAIIIVIMVKNKTNEVKNEFQLNELPPINADQIQKDVKSGISSATEEATKTINQGIHNLLGN